MTTIMDVAARAGVSMKTVSRVLNGEPHVRGTMRERVMNAVAELGYQPNLAARQLAGNRSFLIAYLIPNVNVSYFAAFMVAAASECRRFGYHVVPEIVMFADSEDRRRRIDDIIGRLRPDGILLTPPYSDDHDIIDAVERSKIPLARIGAATPGCGHMVSIDDREISRDLVRHLIEQGHRRIAHIAAPPLHRIALGRAEGYRQALAEAGLPFDEALLVPSEMHFRSGIEAAEGLLNLSNPPTAVFAANDGTALGVMAAARRRGLHIPDDLAVAGFDDTPAGRMAWPPLTSVRQPLEEMAQRAIALLLGKETPKCPLQHQLRIRASTGGPLEYAGDITDA